MPVGLVQRTRYVCPPPPVEGYHWKSTLLPWATTDCTFPVVSAVFEVGQPVDGQRYSPVPRGPALAAVLREREASVRHHEHACEREAAELRRTRRATGEWAALYRAIRDEVGSLFALMSIPLGVSIPEISVCGWHAPLRHWAPPQSWPHRPQLVLVVMSVSQPSLPIPLQSAKPAAHAEAVKEQPLPVQDVIVGDTFMSFVQSLLHDPQ